MMKRIFLLPLLLVLALASNAQIQVDSLSAKQSLKVAGKRIVGISNNIGATINDSELLITKYAALQLVGGGGSFDPTADQTITGNWDFTSDFTVSAPIDIRDYGGRAGITTTNGYQTTVGAPSTVGNGTQFFSDDNAEAMYMYCYDWSYSPIATFNGSGSGSLANGNLTWDSDGNMNFPNSPIYISTANWGIDADGNFNGFALFAGDGTPTASQNWTEDYITSQNFTAIGGEIYADGGDITSDGNGIINAYGVSIGDIFSNTDYGEIHGNWFMADLDLTSTDGSPYASQTWVQEQGYSTDGGGGGYSPSFDDYGNGEIAGYNWSLGSHNIYGGSAFDGGEVSTDGYGNANINGALAVGGSINLGSSAFIFNNGSISFDNGYFVTDGGGNLTAYSYTAIDGAIASQAWVESQGYSTGSGYSPSFNDAGSGIIYGNDWGLGFYEGCYFDGNLMFTDGSGNLNAQSLSIAGNGFINNDGSINFDEGGITSDGNGNLTLNTILANKIGTLNFANDAAAAGAGVPVGGIYNTAGVLKIRIL